MPVRHFTSRVRDLLRLCLSSPGQSTQTFVLRGVKTGTLSNCVFAGLIFQAYGGDEVPNGGDTFQLLLCKEISCRVLISYVRLL